MKLAAIIVAAGSSRRMGFDKLLAPLAGKPVLQWSIKAFAQSPIISEIVVVCPKDRFNQLDLSEINNAQDANPTRILRVDGGNDRHDSVFNGLNALSPDHSLVAIHDGARPLITQEQIQNVYEVALRHSSATSARRITETVKRSDDQGVVKESVDRENLWLMETPQIFSLQLLLQAYEKVKSSGTRVTDEVSAMELIHHPTHLVANPHPNPKITYPEDISQAEIFLNHFLSH